MGSLADWLDQRTGYRSLASAVLDEEIAGGARFAYVFGSALLSVTSKEPPLTGVPTWSISGLSELLPTPP